MRSFWYDNPGHLISLRLFLFLSHPNLGDRAGTHQSPWIDYPGRSLSLLSFNIGFWSPLIGSLVESIECSVNTRADYARLSRPYSVANGAMGLFLHGHFSCHCARSQRYIGPRETNCEHRAKKIRRFDRNRSSDRITVHTSIPATL